MRLLAAAVALALTIPALAQVKVTRALMAPKTLENEQVRHFSFVKKALDAKADGHDAELSAFAAACPPMLKDDPRLPDCQSRRESVLAGIKPYNAEIKAYRDEVRSALEALIARLD